MTKRTRTTLFIFLAALFLLTAPSVIFYSQGYRVDFGEKKVVRTGGFYLKAAPSKADVYINGKIRKSTSIMTGSVFIENLLPGNYEVEIKKNGYNSWKKILGVKEKEVTDAQNIVLFPQNPQFIITDKILPKIINSATSTDKKKIAESSGYEINVLFLEKDLPMGRQGDKVFLTRFSEKIGNIFWLNDYYLIFNAGNKIKISEIDARGSLNIIDLAEFENPKIVWDNNSKKLYILSEEKKYILEDLLP